MSIFRYSICLSLAFFLSSFTSLAKIVSTTETILPVYLDVDGEQVYKFDHPTYIQKGQIVKMKDVLDNPFVQKLHKAILAGQGWHTSAENFLNCISNHLKHESHKMPMESYAVLCANYKSSDANPTGFTGSFINTNQKTLKKTTLTLIHPANKDAFLRFIKNPNANVDLSKMKSTGCLPGLPFTHISCTPINCKDDSGKDFFDCQTPECTGVNHGKVKLKAIYGAAMGFEDSAAAADANMRAMARAGMKDDTSTGDNGGGSDGGVLYEFSAQDLRKKGFDISDAEFKKLRDSSNECFSCPAGYKYNGKNDCQDKNGCALDEKYNPQAKICVPKTCDATDFGIPGQGEGCQGTCKANCAAAELDLDNFKYEVNSSFSNLASQEKYKFQTESHRLLNLLTTNWILESQACKKQNQLSDDCGLENINRQIKQLEQKYRDKTCKTGQIYVDGDCKDQTCHSCLNQKDQLDHYRAMVDSENGVTQFRLGYCNAQDRKLIIHSYLDQINEEIYARLDSCDCDNFSPPLNQASIEAYAASIGVPCLDFHQQIMAPQTPGVH